VRSPNPFAAFVDELSICRDQESQNLKIFQVFESVTSACGKSSHARLSFKELSLGLRALKVRPPALFSRDDWNQMVVRPGLCDAQDRIGREGFTALMRGFLRQHIIEELNKSMRVSRWEEHRLAKRALHHT
jgi:hypothetical protein